MIESFDPIVNMNSKVLILGTMPGNESLRLQQYYAHPRNLFWSMIYSIFDKEPDTKYADRVQFLQSKNIALWDVFEKCDREGSLDSNIKQEVPNDITELLAAHPGINAVFCNGDTAYKQFVKNILPQVKRPLLHARLFSTSPANASIPMQEKFDSWSQVRHILNNHILYKSFIETEFGSIFIYSNGMEIAFVTLPGSDTPSTNQYAILPEDILGKKAKEQIVEYLEGKRMIFDIPVKTYGSSFEQKVYNALSNIPYGVTVSYGELAEAAGNKKSAARAVGQALRKNPVPILLPCHRVISANGKNIGFMGIRNNPMQNMLLSLEEHKYDKF